MRAALSVPLHLLRITFGQDATKKQMSSPAASRSSSHFVIDRRDSPLHVQNRGNKPGVLYDRRRSVTAVVRSRPMSQAESQPDALCFSRTQKIGEAQ